MQGAGIQSLIRELDPTCHNQRPDQPNKKQKMGLFSHSSGGWKSKIKVPSGLVSGETSFLSLQMSTFSSCPHMAFPLCVWREGDVSGESEKSLSCIQLFETSWTVACPWNSPGQNIEVISCSLLQGNLPNPGIEHRSPALQADSLPSEPPEKAKNTGVGSLFLLQQIFPS